MFLGTYTPKLDDKFRLTLPAKFRDELSGGVMITKGPDHSLAVYTREKFNERAAKVVAGSRNNAEARAFIRNFGAGTDEQHPDSQGRITIGPDHREWARLTKDCKVIGAINSLEIWDAAAWDSYSGAHEESFSDADNEVFEGMV